MTDYRIVWDNGATERQGPSTWDASTGRIYRDGEVVQVSEVITKNAGVEVWGKTAGGYVALIYNSQVRAELVTPEPEPTDDEIILDVDVTANVNGVAYTGSMMGLRLTKA